jgi:hypothetical protein
LTSHAELVPVFAEAIASVERGAVAVVDVRVEPGYAPGVASAMLKASE